MRTIFALAVLLLQFGCASNAPLTQKQINPLLVWSVASPVISSAPQDIVKFDHQLVSLQAKALVANLDISQAALRWQIAQRQLGISELRLQPNLGVNVSGSRPIDPQSNERTVQVDGVNVPVSSAAGWTANYGLSVGVSYELDMWGRLAKVKTVQSLLSESAQTDVAAARALTQAQVAKHYWTLASLETQRPLVEEQMALTREALQITKSRVREGKLLSIEISKAAADVFAAEMRIIDSNADSQLQKNQLAAILNEPSTSLAHVQAHIPNEPPPEWSLGSPSEVLSRRPDIQRARLNVDTALARVNIAEAQRYPQLSFSANLNTGGTDSAGWLSQPIGSLAANLVVPLVDWRRLNLQRDVSLIDLELAALGLRDVVQKSFVEVEQVLIESQRLRRQFKVSQLRLEDTAQAEKLAASRLSAGTVGRLDWLQARNAHLDAQLAHIQLGLRSWLNYADMNRVLGTEMWNTGLQNKPHPTSL